jgi:membrane protein DedA with SNARE-associated domain
VELGLVGIALVLLIKEAGVPVPVPGDLIVLGAGVAASQGRLDPILTAVAIVGATIAGGTLQFTILRGRARAALLRLLGRFGIDPESIVRLATPLARSGARGVAVARVTPGVRIVAIPAAALAGIALPRFAAGLSIGNAVFSGGHYLGGLLFGQAAVDALAAGGPVLLAVGLGVAVLGAVGWWLIARRRRRAGDAAVAWMDACCPACLALAAFESRVSAG